MTRATAAAAEQPRASARVTRSAAAESAGTTEDRVALTNQPSPDKNQNRARLPAGKQPKFGLSRPLKSDDAEKDTDSSEEEEADGDFNNAEEPEAFAPSGGKAAPKKRGHQTGLSVDLQNTTLNGTRGGLRLDIPNGTSNGVKRAHSPGSVEADTPLSPTKRARVEESFDDDDDEDDEDDDAYNAVDDISDSEEDPDIELSEERNIIKSEEEIDRVAGRRHQLSAESNRQRHQSVESTDTWQGLDIKGHPEGVFFAEHFARTEPANELDLPSEGFADAGSHSESAPKKVRFAEIDHSSSSGSSSSSEVDTSMFPDLIDQSDLDISLRRIIENDEDDGDDDMLSDGSYWDLETPIADKPVVPVAFVARNVDREGSSSGYETDSDSGETTDEEVITPLTVNRPHTMLHKNVNPRRPQSTLVKRAIPASQARRHSTSARPGKPPVLGSWVADPSKPIAVFDKKQNRLVYYHARSRRMSSNDQASTLDSSRSSSPRTTQSTPLTGLENGSSQLSRRSSFLSPSHPMVQSPIDASTGDNSGTSSRNRSRTSSNDFVTSGFFVGNAGSEFLSLDSVTGPNEAFYPFRYINSKGEIEGDDDDDDDGEAGLNIEDFLIFSDDSSDEGGQEQETPTKATGSVGKNGKAPKLPTITPKKSVGPSSQHLLEHFNRGIVSSFARNQQRRQALTRRSLAASSMLAIKGGRHVMANSPISPLRRRKAGRQLTMFAAGVQDPRPVMKMRPRQNTL